MLGKRFATGTAMIAAFALVLGLDEWAAPWFPLWFLTALVVAGLAGMEIVGLLGETSARPSGNTVFGGAMAMVVANWAPHLGTAWSPASALGEYPPYEPLGAVDALAWPCLAFAAVVMGAFIAQAVQFQRPGATMATIAGSVLAVAYVGLLGSFVLQFRWFEGPYHGIPPLVALVATAKGADVGAYTLGRIAGKHKLWPRLSPNKTVEGALGGLLFGVVAAVLAVGGTRLLGVPSLSWPAAVGFGVVVGSAAQLGDLMESLIKRDCERKDASAALPGFGGVLDVMDSLLFAGPVAYGYWLAFGP